MGLLWFFCYELFDKRQLLWHNGILFAPQLKLLREVFCVCYQFLSCRMPNIRAKTSLVFSFTISQSCLEQHRIYKMNKIQSKLFVISQKTKFLLALKKQQLAWSNSVEFKLTKKITFWDIILDIRVVSHQSLLYHNTGEQSFIYCWNLRQQNSSPNLAVLWFFPIPNTSEQMSELMSSAINQIVSDLLNVWKTITRFHDNVFNLCCNQT